MTWTDERIEQLQTMWGDGMSAGQIGRVMDITRSAVIGKVHRCGFHQTVTRKDNPDNQKMRGGRPKAVFAFRARPTRKPKPVFNFASVFGPYPAGEPQTYVPKASEIVCLGIPFYQLDKNQCRFIPGNPVYDAPSCGHPVKPGASFCPGHTALCFTPIPSRSKYTDRHINFVAKMTADAGRPVEVAAA